MKNQINWEERYFQTCLSILSGLMANPRYHETMAVGIKPILAKAEELITHLKEREKMENIEGAK